MKPIWFAAPAVASAVFVGCSGGNLPASSAGALSHAAAVSADGRGNTTGRCTGTKIYVADYAKSAVIAYVQGASNPSPCGKITTGINDPEGIYIDNKGTLYVGNYGGFSNATITEYPKRAKTPNLTITPSAPAYDVFVGRDGILYSAQPTNETVAEYAAGTTTPLRTISMGGGPYGVATDKANNLYVSYLSNADGVSHVEKFAPGSTTGTDLGITLSFSGEVKLDTGNDVILGDRNNNDEVYIYPPGQSTPSRSFATPGGNPVYFCLDKTEATFYVSGFNAVQAIDYQSGSPITNISTGLTSPSGVAAYPPAPY